MCKSCGCGLSDKKDPRYGQGAPKGKKGVAKGKKGKK